LAIGSFQERPVLHTNHLCLRKDVVPALLQILQTDFGTLDM